MFTSIISDYHFAYFTKLITNISYLSATFFILKKISKPDSNKNYTSQMSWLSWLVIGGLVLCLISFSGFLLNKIDSELAPMSGDYLLGAFLGLYLFLLVFVLFRNSNVFQQKWAPERLNPDEHKAFSNLLIFMESEKPFLDTGLSLHSLSHLVSIPSGKLSRLIILNGYANFHEFVNHYRVKEVQQKMMDKTQSHLNLLGMAMDSGFNSKASFNRAFKQIAGVTPSEYRNKLSSKSKQSVNSQG